MSALPTYDPDTRTLTWHRQADWVEAGREAVDAGGFRREQLAARFIGGTVEQAHKYARDGWLEGVQAPDTRTAAQIAERLAPFHRRRGVTRSVAGFRPDVAAYMAGRPDHMLKHGTRTANLPVVTLVVGCGARGSIGHDHIARRGTVISSIVSGLLASGRQVEIWADWTISGSGYSGRLTDRVLVKGARDVVDPARLAYILGSPLAHRVYRFGAGASRQAKEAGYPYRWDWPGYCRSHDPRPEAYVDGAVLVPKIAGPWYDRDTEALLNIVTAALT